MGQPHVYIPTIIFYNNIMIIFYNNMMISLFMLLVSIDTSNVYQDQLLLGLDPDEMSLIIL